VGVGDAVVGCLWGVVVGVECWSAVGLVDFSRIRRVVLPAGSWRGGGGCG